MIALGVSCHPTIQVQRRVANSPLPADRVLIAIHAMGCLMAARLCRGQGRQGLLLYSDIYVCVYCAMSCQS